MRTTTLTQPRKESRTNSDRGARPLSHYAKEKVKVFCLLDFYLPGYKAGGPIRTLANMVNHLSDEFEFWIVTRDRDLGDTTPYLNVNAGQWKAVDRSYVYYLPSSEWKLLKLYQLLNETPHDVIYLNSFFSSFVTFPTLLMRRLGFLKQRPVVLAPRGEFAPAALKLKKDKKQFYLRIAKIFHLYENIIWQASSNEEKSTIEKCSCTFLPNGVQPEVLVAPDLLPIVPKPTGANLEQRQLGVARVIFLSRISPMKNLDFLLRCLRKVQEPLLLHLYGPKEDLDYWSHCEKIIYQLPANIQVEYRGKVNHQDVGDVFSSYDLFAFPTRGENFGHVIFESLFAGTPVLLSNCTPWCSDKDGGLTVLPLDEQIWCDHFSNWLQLGGYKSLEKRKAAAAIAQAAVLDQSALRLNRSLFRHALELVTNDH